jgi:hypothetical protein
MTDMIGILDSWSRYRQRQRQEREKAAVLDELIERMVQDSDPSIRGVPDYRRQLRKPVENALKHIEGLIASIPGPFNLSAESWDKDPLVHALFVSPDEVCALLQNCAELQAFFRKGGARTATALLTATIKERTVFGTAQEGDIVRRDVPQAAVEFYDHRIVAPSSNEAENRRELVHRGLNLLATQTLEEILKIHSIREELTAERRILAVKLKIQHTRERGLELLLASGGKSHSDETPAHQLLEEIDQQLLELESGSGTPQDFLKQLATVLLGPSHVLKGKTIGMRLNWMGVKIDESSSQGGGEVTLAELEIPGRIKRVAVLAKVAVGECLGRES